MSSNPFRIANESGGRSAGWIEFDSERFILTVVWIGFNFEMTRVFGLNCSLLFAFFLVPIRIRSSFCLTDSNSTTTECLSYLFF